MIKNDTRVGPIAILALVVASVRALQPEDAVIRRIDYDFDLIRMTTARRVDLLSCEIHGQHEIREADAPLLQSLQHGYAEAVLRQLEDRLHELRHGIVQIQNDFCTEQFRDNRTENENVRHVMHMDQIVMPRE